MRANQKSLLMFGRRGGRRLGAARSLWQTTAGAFIHLPAIFRKSPLLRRKNAKWADVASSGFHFAAPADNLPL
jgi:hypothetical protein